MSEIILDQRALSMIKLVFAASALYHPRSDGYEKYEE
jgi:hypothetical protein